MRSSATRSALLAAAAALLGCTEPTVVRVIDGREIAGRFVSPQAYALYARGAEAEAAGDLQNARLEYLAAAREDSGGAEIWTRVGAVSCALGRADEAQSAFDRAAERGADYEPLYRERAACALSRAPLTPERGRAAFKDASQALALDPNSEQTALLYARAAEAAGEPSRAEHALRELVVRAPGRAAGWRALRAFAERRGDAPAAARAALALVALGGEDPPSATVGGPGAPPKGAAGAAPAPKRSALDDVDAALTRDALDEARTAAKRAHLPPAELAVRAAALGRAQLAKAQAELVFSADLGSASAAIALAVASDLLHGDQGVARALSDMQGRTTPPSPLARLLFAELIERRTDREAARAFLGPLPAPPAEGDALLTAVWKRVAASLQK